MKKHHKKKIPHFRPVSSLSLDYNHTSQSSTRKTLRKKFSEECIKRPELRPNEYVLSEEKQNRKSRWVSTMPQGGCTKDRVTAAIRFHNMACLKKPFHIWCLKKGVSDDSCRQTKMKRIELGECLKREANPKSLSTNRVQVRVLLRFWETDRLEVYWILFLSTNFIDKVPWAITKDIRLHWESIKRTLKYSPIRENQKGRRSIEF